MLDNILQRAASARGHLDRGETARKGEEISKSIAVIGALNGSLNMEAGGDIALNLRALYEYCTLRLVNANAHHDAAGFDEVLGLVRTIKEGWDGIGAEVRPGSAEAAR